MSNTMRTATATDPFAEVAGLLNSAGKLAAEANQALDPAVTAVRDLDSALDDVDSFVAVLNDLDEIVTLTSGVVVAASSVSEEIPVLGEVLDMMDAGLSAIKKVYQKPLEAVNKVDKDVIKAVKPELDKISGALTTAQRDLALAAEKLPQYAQTVELVGALMSILHAVIAAFPDEGKDSPGERLKALMGGWDKVRIDAKSDVHAVTTVLGAVKETVAAALAPIGTAFKPAEKVIHAAMSPIQSVIDEVKPWGEKIHHAISQSKALKWLMKMMSWLGKAVTWVMDKISLGKLFDWLASMALEPLLAKLHLSAIEAAIKYNLPSATNLAKYLGALGDVPAKLTALGQTLKQYRTSADGDPLHALTEAVLDAVTGTTPTGSPDLPDWNPPPVINEESAKAAVDNRMKYVSQYTARGNTYQACFTALKGVSTVTGAATPPVQQPVEAAPASPTASSDSSSPKPKPLPRGFPDPQPLGREWSGLNDLRAAIDQATNLVTAGETDAQRLQQALARLDQQENLAPLLDADMSDLAALWTDVSGILTRVEAASAGTPLEPLVKGFIEGAADQVTAANALTVQSHRFQQNAKTLDSIIAQAETALTSKLTNAISHDGAGYVDAVVRRYATWADGTNTIPRGVGELVAADSGRAHAAAIATVQKELNTAAGALVTVVRASASGAGDVHQAVNALYAELDGYAKQASTIEDPINRVRDHLSSLHTIDHYLRVADSILDPLSWIARKYVCKNDDTFSGVHAALKEAGSWGSSAVSGWLEAGVRAAIDALGDAELHLQQTTTALKAVNNSLEGTGIAQARRATDAITAAICKLDGQLVLQQANTGTDWLSQALQTQLDNLAGEIIGAGAH